MTRLLRSVSIVCIAILALSCTKSLNHQICKDIEFMEHHLHIEDSKSGNAHFAAWTKGTSMDATFLLDIIFNDFASIKPGQRATPVLVNFANPLINGSAGFTSEYSGSIYLVKKTETEAEITFDKVTMNILNTDFLFDGCLTCQIE